MNRWFCEECGRSRTLEKGWTWTLCGCGSRDISYDGAVD